MAPQSDKSYNPPNIMSAVPKPVYDCPHCLRQYRRKRERDLHIGLCELMSKNKTERSRELERSQDIMSPEEMNDMIKVLITEQSRLRNQVSVLQQQLSSMKRKVNVVDHLNQLPQKPMDFDDWLEQIKFDKATFETLLEDGVRTAIDNIFTELTRFPDNVPIRAFTKNSNGTYCYRNELWRKMEETDWNDVVSPFYVQIQNQLDRYSNGSKDERHTERDDIARSFNLQKILKSFDKLESTVPSVLIQKVKMNLTNVTTFEFTFT